MVLIKNAKVYAPEYVGKKEFLHRGLLISMFMLPEAVGKEAFIPVHRNFSCQNW